MVTEQQIFEKIKAVLTETFEVPAEKITLEAKLYDDLEIDSIDAVDMLVELAPFLGNKKISPAAFKQVRTVGDVVQAIHTLLKTE